MNLPIHVTHYYEEEYGPFLNVCDADDKTLDALIEKEASAKTAFNRYAQGKDFFRCRKAADDLLIDVYEKKFGNPPSGRPFYCTLGSFDKTLTMYREGRCLRLPISDFTPGQLTFMYPDHFHLVSYFDADVPRFCYQLPKNWQEQEFWGKLFTYEELCDAYDKMGIGNMINSWLSKDGWAGCYVEGQIWDRSLRKKWSEQGACTQPSVAKAPSGE